MPSNVWCPAVRALDAEFPGRLGNLISPGAWRGPMSDYYALDNGRYKAREWTEKMYWEHLDTAVRRAVQPQWVAVPDVYLDYNATLWGWAHRIRGTYGWPLAFVWQNGITVDDVKKYTDAEVQFIGGDDNLHTGKYEMVRQAVAHFPRVHVGRVNAPRPALRCKKLGVESIDGTGWRMTNRQRAGMRLVLEKIRAGTLDLEPPLIEDAATFVTAFLETAVDR
jgi:hypothetical protein